MSRGRIAKRGKLRVSSGGAAPRRIHELEYVLRPFARFTHEPDPMKHNPGEIFVPTDGDVWFYVGERDQLGKTHLHTNDFRAVREVLGMTP